MKEYNIYVLIDPRPNIKNKIFYVGMTSSKMGAFRLGSHIQEDGKTKKNLRINDIINSGSLPELKIVKKCSTKEKALLTESRLIFVLRNICNFDLTNGPARFNPIKKSKGSKVRINITVDEDAHNWIKGYLNSVGQTFSGWANSELKKYQERKMNE